MRRFTFSHFSLSQLLFAITIFCIAVAAVSRAVRIYRLEIELEQAVVEGNVAKAMDLIEKGAPINTTVGGWNILFVVARNGNLAAAKRLIELGIDIDKAGPSDTTPLGQAVAMNETEMARLLLENGADPNINYESPHAALHILENARRSKNEEMIRLLESYDAK